jgi:hypothetical protein
MSPVLSRRVMNALEHVCKLGCRRVHEVIHDLESGRAPKEIDDLGDHERKRVLHELKQIMNVYKDGACGT